MLALSVDSLFSHLAWVRDIRQRFGVSIAFSIIEDPSMAVATAYGMLPPGAPDALRGVGLMTSRREARSVFYQLTDPGARHLVTSVPAGFGAAAPAAVSAGPSRVAEQPIGVAHLARVPA